MPCHIGHRRLRSLGWPALMVVRSSVPAVFSACLAGSGKGSSILAAVFMICFD
jgi:hypothetical protein